MEILRQILDNRLLISALAAWAAAQITKAVLYAVMNRSIDWKRLVGDGGMPSCHSAFVCGLAASAALHCGLNSEIFALSAVLAVVVMHDARGVRRESGRHAKALNELLDFLKGEEAPDAKLKEMLGHSPLQVLAGALIGILIALLFR